MPRQSIESPYTWIFPHRNKQHTTPKSFQTIELQNFTLRWSIFILHASCSLPHSINRVLNVLWTCTRNHTHCKVKCVYINTCWFQLRVPYLVEEIHGVVDDFWIVDAGGQEMSGFLFRLFIIVGRRWRVAFSCHAVGSWFEYKRACMDCFLVSTTRTKDSSFVRIKIFSDFLMK